MLWDGRFVSQLRLLETWPLGKYMFYLSIKTQNSKHIIVIKGQLQPNRNWSLINLINLWISLWHLNKEELNSFFNVNQVETYYHSAIHQSTLVNDNCKEMQDWLNEQSIIIKTITQESMNHEKWIIITVNLISKANQ